MRKELQRGHFICTKVQLNWSKQKLVMSCIAFWKMMSTYQMQTNWINKEEQDTHYEDSQILLLTGNTWHKTFMAQLFNSRRVYAEVNNFLLFAYFFFSVWSYFSTSLLFLPLSAVARNSTSSERTSPSSCFVLCCKICPDGTQCKIHHRAYWFFYLFVYDNDTYLLNWCSYY